MLEVGDHLVEQVHQIHFFPKALGLEAGNHLEEVVEQFLLINRLILDHTKGIETRHIEHFLVGEELFEILFAGGVAIKEITRPLALGNQLLGTVAGLVFRRALVRLVAQRLQITHRNFRERDEVKFFAELGEEDVAVLAQQAGHQAQFAGLLGRHKIAADILGRRDRLALGKALVEAVQQAAVREGHVGKTSRRDRQRLAGAHQEHFHDPLAGAHHVDRVGRLVGGHAEILLGAESLGRLDGGDGVEDVNVHHPHQRKGVFLAAHVLEGRQVEHVVVTTGPLDQRIVLQGTTIDGKGAEIAVDIAESAAHIAHQLDHVVLGDIHYMQGLRLALEDLARHRLADGAGATDHQEAALRDDAGQLRLMARHVGGEQGLFTANQTQNIHSLHSNFRHGYAGRDVHNPVFQPQRVFEPIVLAMLEHLELGHHSPDRAGHHALVVGVLEEAVPLLTTIQYDRIEPVVGRCPLRLADERHPLLGEELRVSLGKVTFDPDKLVELLKLGTTQRGIQIG